MNQRCEKREIRLDPATHYTGVRIFITSKEIARMRRILPKFIHVNKPDDIVAFEREQRLAGHRQGRGLADVATLGRL
jgi:hypothetical protein